MTAVLGLNSGTSSRGHVEDFSTVLFAPLTVWKTVVFEFIFENLKREMTIKNSLLFRDNNNLCFCKSTTTLKKLLMIYIQIIIRTNSPSLKKQVPKSEPKSSWTTINNLLCNCRVCLWFQGPLPGKQTVLRVSDSLPTHEEWIALCWPKYIFGQGIIIESYWPWITFSYSAFRALILGNMSIYGCMLPDTIHLGIISHPNLSSNEGCTIQNKLDKALWMWQENQKKKPTTDLGMLQFQS